MFALGLRFAEKLLNAYVYDLKPSIMRRCTTHKTITIFPTLAPFLTSQQEEDLRMAYLPGARHDVDLKAVDQDGNRIGPLTFWEDAGREEPGEPQLEFYLELNEDELPHKPLETYEIEEGGVGVSAGLLFPEGLPMIMRVEVDNDMLGLENHVLLQIKANLRFQVEIEWDDDFVYPDFKEWTMHDA